MPIRLREAEGCGFVAILCDVCGEPVQGLAAGHIYFAPIAEPERPEKGGSRTWIVHSGTCSRVFKSGLGKNMASAPGIGLNVDWREVERYPEGAYKEF